jgi:hypothetical protein
MNKKYRCELHKNMQCCISMVLHIYIRYTGWSRGYACFFKWLVLGKGGVDDIGHEPADSSDNAVSGAMVHWNVEHRVFAVEQFF